MAYFILKQNEDDEGTRYEVPKAITIGEEEAAVRAYGQDAAYLGVVWIAVRRRFPATTPKDIADCIAEMHEDEADQVPPTFAAGKPFSAENGKPTEAVDTGSLGSESTTA